MSQHTTEDLYNEMIKSSIATCMAGVNGIWGYLQFDFFLLINFRDMTQLILKNYCASATILAYGQTSSGKTVGSPYRLSMWRVHSTFSSVNWISLLVQFTMSGTGDEPGIVQYCTNDIFDAIEVIMKNLTVLVFVFGFAFWELHITLPTCLCICAVLWSRILVASIDVRNI